MWSLEREKERELEEDCAQPPPLPPPRQGRRCRRRAVTEDGLRGGTEAFVTVKLKLSCCSVAGMEMDKILS